MQSSTIASSPEPSAGRGFAGMLLFLAMFFFYWISLTPFVDLTGAAVFDPSAGNSNSLNQIVSLLLFAAALGFGLTHPLRHVILQPRWLLALIFTWFLFVSTIGAHPMLGYKAVVLSVIVTVNACVMLLLPTSERHFAKLLAIGSLATLGLSYYGIVMLPQLSIHQASELAEPMNAGFWRGHFPHKNSAAAAMVILTFFGLYVMKSWSRMAGLAIVVLAFWFLLHTGGKTATAMLPAIILLGWVFERLRFMRVPMVIGGVVLFNLFAVGSAAYPLLAKLISDLGIDATFTNRSDIWRFAFTAFAHDPIIGYGLKAFWQTSELVYGGGRVETWAVEAANGHNSYLDIALMTGVPGLVLTFIWIVIAPLRGFSRVISDGAASDLTRLYLRIWLYIIFHAGLESIFYEGGNPLWFTFVMALYGIRFQQSASLVRDSAPVANAAVSYA